MPVCEALDTSARGEGYPVLIIGQIPFSWIGVPKLDDATREIAHEPHWIAASMACAALAG